MHKALGTFRWFRGYAGANLRAAIEYRVSFISEVGGMILNNALWVSFWVAFFEHYPSVQGWQRPQVVTIWALLCLSFGLTNVLFGNVMRLSSLIVRGELDFYLTLPRSVLWHVLIGRMSVTALGDVVFGPIVFVLFVHPSVGDMALFMLLGVSSAAIVLGFAVSVGSLGFWFDSAPGLTNLAVHVLLNLATYPTSLFGPFLRVALFSVMPAGLIGFVPVEILRQGRLDWLAGVIAAACLFVWLGQYLFTRGLRRYESGNLLLARV